MFEFDISEGLPSVNEVLDEIPIPDWVYAATQGGVDCALVLGWWLDVRDHISVVECVGFVDPVCGPSYELVDVSGADRAATLRKVREVLLGVA